MAVLGTAGPGAENVYKALVCKFLLTKIILQFVFRENSNALKLYSVGSDESFVIYLYIIDCTGKRNVFHKMDKLFLFRKYVLKESHVKIKNTGCIYMFSCDIIKISNC